MVRTRTDTNDKKQRAAYKAFVKAQAWARSHEVPSKMRSLMQECIEDKSISQLRKILLAMPRYAIWVNILNDAFNGVFKCTRLAKGKYLAETIKGLAYPYYEPRCRGCTKLLDRLQLTTCSDECRKLVAGPKRSIGVKRNLATKTPEQIQTHVKAIQQACLEKYGVISPMQTQEIKDRAKATYEARSEEDKTLAREKYKTTMLSLYGAEHPMHVPEIAAKARDNAVLRSDAEKQASKEKKEATMMARHGVKHQIYIDTVRKRITKFQTHKIKLNGITYEYQGYEGYVLEYLVTNGYRVTTKVKGIPYSTGTKVSQYYPDIKAVFGKRKLLIEVKSTYTFQWTKSTCPEKLFAGTEWALSNGADFLVIVVLPQKRKMLIIKNPKTIKHLTAKNGTVQLF